jgi:FAD:protein FMN transferase
MKKIMMILTVMLTLTACSSQNKNLKRYNAVSITSGFDTKMELIAYAHNEKEFNKYFELFKDTFWKYHELFDKYNEYDGINNIYTINKNAGIAPVEVDPIIIELLLQSKHYTDLSPYFDVTFGSVFKVWHNYREEGEELNAMGQPGNIPTQDELEEARKYTGWDKVVIDKEKNTVYLTHPQTELDVGAIAKGYATEMVARKLEEEGLKHAILSGGGNIRTINTKPDNIPWQIGISEPNLSLDSPSVDVFSIKQSTSIVTSGDYQRTYYAKDGKNYSHLINTKTLYPETLYRSTSIITKDSTMADALSTTLYMMSKEEAEIFINDFNAKYPENKIEVFWIMDDNPDWYQGPYDYTMTSGLKEISKNLNEKD